MFVAKQVNLMRVTNIVSPGAQYFRRECLELTSIPETSDNNTLKSIILKIFGRLEVKVDSSNVEACHCISSKNGPKQVIVEVSKCKDANKICFSKKIIPYK